jgi:hypothetical protein
MNRSERLYHNRRVRARHVRRLYEEHRCYFQRPSRGSRGPQWRWKPMCKLTMNGCPKAWDVAMHTRPARHRASHMLQLTLRGREFDRTDFSDYRRPYIYYW